MARVYSHMFWKFLYDCFLTCRKQLSSLRPEIANDSSLMQYAVKGSDEQWEKALDGKDNVIDESSGTVQIRSIREKRKSLDDEDFEKEAQFEQQSKKAGKSKKKKRHRR